jgi:hypothetical protein
MEYEGRRGQQDEPAIKNAMKKYERGKKEKEKAVTQECRPACLLLYVACWLAVPRLLLLMLQG